MPPLPPLDRAVPAPPNRHPGLITRHEAAAILGFTAHSFRQWQLRCRTPIRRWTQEVGKERGADFKVALFAVEDILALRHEILQSREAEQFEGPPNAPLPPEGSLVPVGFPGLLDRKDAPAFLGISRTTLCVWQRRTKTPLRRWKQASATRPRPVLFAEEDLLDLKREFEKLYEPYSGPADAPLPPPETVVPEGYPGLVTQRQAAEMFGIAFSSWIKWQTEGNTPARRWYQMSPLPSRPVLLALEDLEKMRADLEAYYGPYSGPPDVPLPSHKEPVQPGYPGLATRQQAAKLLGVAFSTWNHWERMGSVPKRRWRQRIPIGVRPVLYAVEDLVVMRQEMEARERPRPDPELPGAWRVPIRSHIHDLEAIIDEQDLPLVEGKAWNYRENGDGYIGDVLLAYEPQTTLKRMLLGLEGPEHRIRFANGNPLDCRRSNIVVQTIQEQVRTNRKMRKRAGRKCTSKFKGVCWCEERGRWLAQIRREGVHHHLGRFDEEEDAALAYDKAALELFGEHARLNFPDNPRDTAVRAESPAAEKHSNVPNRAAA